MNYLYRCPNCGPIEVAIRADAFVCLDCGAEAKRVWQVNIDAKSARPTDRYWDPQVGAVIGSQREFNDLLRQGQDRESEEIGMDCRLTTVDARDDDALGELHHTGKDHRLAEKENTKRRHHDEKAKANKESKAKVLTP